MGRTIGGFLRSRHNLAGCVLAAGGVGLHVAGLVAGLEFLPLAAGLYVLGAVVVPRKRHQLDPYPEDETDAAGIHRALDQLLRSLAGRVPGEIFDKAASIRASILVTLDHGAGTSIADPNVFLIRQTALSYLPEALNEYLSLPRGYANQNLLGKKSPHDVLVDQLNLMDEKMREVAETIVANDAERLEAHGRFLADKLGGSSLDIGASEEDQALAAARAQALDEARAAVPPVTVALGSAPPSGTTPVAAAAPTAEQKALDAEARAVEERRQVAARVLKAAEKARAIAAQLSGATPAASAAPSAAPTAAPTPEAQQAAEDYKAALDRIRG